MDYLFSKGFLIGHELVKRKYITQDQLDEGLIYQQRKGAGKIKLGEALIELGYLNRKDLINVIAAQLSIPCIDFAVLAVTDDLLQQVPKELVKSYTVFPVAYTETDVRVCVPDPLDTTIHRILSDHIDKTVVFAIAEREEIRAAIDKYYHYE